MSVVLTVCRSFKVCVLTSEEGRRSESDVEFLVKGVPVILLTTEFGVSKPHQTIYRCLFTMVEGCNRLYGCYSTFRFKLKYVKFEKT